MTLSLPTSIPPVQTTETSKKKSSCSSFFSRFVKKLKTAKRNLSALFFQRIKNPPNKGHYFSDTLLAPARTIRSLTTKKSGFIEVDGKNATHLPQEKPSKRKIAVSILALPFTTVLGMIAKPFSLLDPKYREQFRTVLRALEKAKNVSTSTLENRPCEFSENDQIKNMPIEVHFHIMTFLTKKERSTLAIASRYWNSSTKSCSSAIQEYRENCPTILFSFVTPNQYFRLPTLLVPAHRSGISKSTKKPLIQKQGKAVIPTTLIDMIAQKTVTHPITRLIDPWGRPALAIRYQYSFLDEKAHLGYRSEIGVLVLHAVHNKKDSPWVGAQTDLSSISHHQQPGVHFEFETPKIQSFFPEGWNKENNLRFSHAANYLSRLLKGEPCGLCKIDHDIKSGRITIEETSPTFSLYGEEIPYIQIVNLG